MRKPLDRLKLLPWRSLFQAALMAVVLLALPVDVLLLLASRYAAQSPALESLLSLLLSPLLSLIISLGLPIGLGALAVYVLERIDRSSISTGSLWGLVLCVFLLLLLEKGIILGAPGFSMTVLALIAVGVFWKGRSHWRSYRRW
ncbi:peptide chain release factor 1 [Leptolyngbya sp. FACHB-321]|uniref:peptide chain release factor 1 n=1 Tax=Leptolyngbya sp. FACHB-321 TaxID=2692807 RepID=UPI00168417D9|nr:peptide chain release factor 1 [Leptolyngbya sp. FACHB-321]MBD2035143.1 peptide chain release factor 1 [Leptolyngbya sp. FACHB-321]